MQSFDPEKIRLRGKHSIEASAGTGKTHSITLLWLRLIVEENLEVESVLVSTFTKAATAELKERLLATLRRAERAAASLEGGELPPSTPESRIVQGWLADCKESASALGSRLARALSAFDLAPVSTLHSFCQSLIKRHAVELGTDPGQILVEGCREHLLPIVHDELLRLSTDAEVDPSALSHVANTVASNPEAVILGAEPFCPDELQAIQEQMGAEAPALLAACAHAGTRKSLSGFFKKIQNAEPVESVSEPQKKALGPEILVLLEQYRRMLERQKKGANLQMARAVRSRLETAKESAGIRTFDDITRTVRLALSKQGPEGPLANSVRSRLKAAIIDECQDSDSVQIEVFSHLFLHQDIVSFIVIGDPKQSIYRFRGADLESYRTLSLHAEQRSQMETNFRSDESLISALNGLYGREFAFPNQLVSGESIEYVPVKAAVTEKRFTDAEESSPVVVLWTDEEDRYGAQTQISKMAAAECHRLLSSQVFVVDRHTKEQRRLSPGDIAFLASNSRELRTVRTSLSRLGIPTELSGKGLGSVFRSEEATDVLAWLEVLEGLQQRGDILGKLLAFLASPLSGFHPSRLVELAGSASLQSRMCSELKSDLEAVERHGPLPALLDRISRTEVIRENLPYAEGERRLTNWRQIASILQAEHASGRRGVSALLRRMSRMTVEADAGLLTEEQTQMRLETDRPAVQLMTIHASKGLEFPVVFCPFLWAVRSRQWRRLQCHAPLLRNHAGWSIDVGSAEFEQSLGVALEQEDDEEHRKLYVALTRPRHRLYLGCAPVPASRGHDNGAANSPLVRLPGLGLEGREPAQWRVALEGSPWVRLRSNAEAFEKIRRGLSAVPCEIGASIGASYVRGPQVAFHSLPSRVVSFSSLCRSASETHSPKDRDEERQSPFVAGPSSDDLLASLGAPGAELGDRVHAALEEYLGNRVPISEALGFLGEEGAREVWEVALEKIVSSPFELPGKGRVSLEGIRGRCMTEMQFHLPVPQMAADELGQAFLQDPEISGHATRAAWAESIGHFGFERFRGFLQGYIDLIFEHEGRWYVVDYKTNRLKGYGAMDLEEAMQEHHYLLQARLYALALHRHLGVNLSGYEYSTHFGGVVYLFLRGMPGAGIWTHTPSAEAMDRFGKLF
jgi:exodeoxyribonuclease V beta subunit